MKVAKIRNQEKIEFLAPFEVEAIKKGRAIGKLEGKLEGKALGITTILEKQIKIKFGSISIEVHKKLRSANQDELVSWAEKILGANSIEELFAV